MKDTLRKNSPKAWAWFATKCWDFRLDNLLVFLDQQQVYLTTTVVREEDKPWGYEVISPRRFLREQCNYTTRPEAEEAGLVSAFEELEKILS